MPTQPKNSIFFIAILDSTKKLGRKNKIKKIESKINKVFYLLFKIILFIFYNFLFKN